MHVELITNWNESTLPKKKSCASKFISRSYIPQP